MLVLMLFSGAALCEPMPELRAAVMTEAEGNALRVTGSSDWKSKVVALEWYDGGSRVLKKGKYGYLYDVKSGAYLKIKRMGGTAHADCEPASKSDTAKLKKMGYSYKRRPGILYANGKFVAVSFTTQPHGDQTITTNGYNGQFCLHMAGSMTHGSEEVNVNHQAAIARAYKWAH
jgi:hypothetical protein